MSYHLMAPGQQKPQSQEKAPQDPHGNQTQTNPPPHHANQQRTPTKPKDLHLKSHQQREKSTTKRNQNTLANISTTIAAAEERIAHSPIFTVQPLQAT